MVGCLFYMWYVLSQIFLLKNKKRTVLCQVIGHFSLAYTVSAAMFQI